MTTASLAVAQITSATLSGTIKDDQGESGGVLHAVDVVVKNLDTGLRATFVVRMSVPSATLAQPVVAAIRAIDPEQPVVDIRTMVCATTN